MRNENNINGYLVRAYSLEPISNMEDTIEKEGNRYGFIQVTGIFEDRKIPNIAFAYQSQIQYIIRYAKEEFYEIHKAAVNSIIDIGKVKSISEDNNEAIDIAITLGNDAEVETLYYRIEIVS